VVHYACNGEDGEKGDPGDPWTPGVLPSGSTETGAWAVADKGASFGPVTGAVAPITFSIPLAAEIGEANTHLITESSTAEQKAFCDNGAGEAASVTNPEADPGHFCAFVGFLFGSSPTPPAIRKSLVEDGMGKPGGLLFFTDPEAEGVFGSGSFAVTAAP